MKLHMVVKVSLQWRIKEKINGFTFSFQHQLSLLYFHTPLRVRRFTVRVKLHFFKINHQEKKGV